MKKIIFVFLLAFFSVSLLKAQTKSGNALDTAVQVYTYVEQMPEFPGGETALYNFIVKNVVYPQTAMRDSISGKVILQFTVTKDGKIADVEVTRSVRKDLDDEAVRVVKAMPAWKPGMQNGVKVNVRYRIPVNFRFN